MNSPIIPVEFHTGSAGLVTGFNAYGRNMTGTLQADVDFGYYIKSDEKVLFDVVYIKVEE
jgi:hypothetical protein